MSVEITAQVSKNISAPPAEVWRALTTPALLKKFFFGAEVESEWMVGRPIRFRGEFKGKAYEDKGELKTITPSKELTFSHFSPLSGQPDVPENYHLVSFVLSPTPEGTQVTLSQSNLVGGVKASDRDHRSEFEKNWMTVLNGLSKVVESMPGSAVSTRSSPQT